MPIVSSKAYQTNLPTPIGDGVSLGLWLNRYGALVDHPLGVGPLDALLPILYRATTPTWGTGIAMTSAARTTFSATECTALFRNTAGAGGKYVVPLWIKMIATAAGTAGTNLNFGLITDTTNRYSSGGSTLSGVAGANSAKTDATDTPVGTVYAGAITASAASAPRQMGRDTPITRAAATALVAGDEIMVTFGSAESVPPQVLAATASRYVVRFAAIAIAPGHSALLHMWSAAQTAAPSAEYEMAWLEL